MPDASLPTYYTGYPEEGKGEKGPYQRSDGVVIDPGGSEDVPGEYGL